MLDPRMVVVIETLSTADGYVPIDTLGRKLSMSVRSVRALVRENEEILAAHGAGLVLKSNIGYRLEVSDSAAFSAYLREQLARLNEERYERPLTSMERRNWLIRSFLLRQDGLKVDEIADGLFVSKSTVVSDLKLVREELARYHLSLDSKVRSGLYLVGKESDIRRCISDYFFYNNYVESNTFAKQPLGQFDLKYEKEVEQIVMHRLNAVHYQMTDVGIHNLIIHILIALFRIQSGMQREEQNAFDTLSYPLEFSLAREMRDDIFEKTNIRIPDSDLGYMVIHMIGTRVLTERDADMIHAETLNLVRSIFTKILNVYGIDLFADIDLFTMLCTHLQPMVMRIQNHIRMRNPLLLQVQNQDPVGYEMAVLAAGMVEEMYHAPVDENEIGYLALHFDLALQRRTQMSLKKILCVCASGMGTSRLLMYKLRQEFSNQIAQLDAVGLHELEGMDLEAYDLIVTTVPLSCKTGTKVIQVEYFLSSEDVDHIQNSLNGTDQGYQSVAGALDEDLFFTDLAGHSQTEVIHTLCSRLEKKISVPTDFEKSVLERERLSSTAMGNGIAMPHALTLMLEETKIVVAHFQKPILWGKHQVQWVFLLGIQSSQDDSVDHLVDALYGLLNHTSLKKRIDENPTYACLVQTLDELVSINQNKKPESIFQ